jgi:hypothetical protein
MSTSAVGGAGSSVSQSLYQYYYQAMQQTQSQLAGSPDSGSSGTTGSTTASNAASALTPSTSPTAGATPGTTDSSPTGLANQVGQHRHGGGGGLFKQIQQAVTSALQQNDSSGTPVDPNQVIEDAIENVLQQNQAGSTSTTGTSTTGTATTANAQTNSSGTSGKSSGSAAGTSNQQAFAALLAQNGVNAQQFQQDLLSALQGANGGQFDAATAFQSFPPGSIVDTLA